jgi:hypothetical protein
MRVGGPQLHFLTSGALDRLHNGATVTYELQLSVRTEQTGHALSRVLQRFTFSYDLWEEKFSVTRLDSPARSASNLSASRAEGWCLNNLSLPLADLPGERQFWVALEYETVEPRDSSGSDNAALATLSGLIDIFSRRPKDDQHIHGIDEVGPFRLADLKRGR